MDHLTPISLDQLADVSGGEFNVPWRRYGEHIATMAVSGGTVGALAGAYAGGVRGLAAGTLAGGLLGGALGTVTGALSIAATPR